MARVLYLVHRIPYPPNKGDKVRSYHLLRMLARRHEVLLGTCIDDPEDLPHVNALRAWCRDIVAVPLRPWRKVLSGLAALLVDRPLTQVWFHDRRLLEWVRGLRDSGAVDAVVVFSSAMAPYAEGFDVPVLLDLVDLDSAKWAEYAASAPFPMSRLYAREARTLLAGELRAVDRSQAVFLVTRREASLLAQRSPRDCGRVEVVANGVDVEFFDPAMRLDDPYQGDPLTMVFTGSMDYPPNVDAMRWFCAEILPSVMQVQPQARLYIVGRNPTRAVRSLSGERVCVTGRVDDVRPFLKFAALAVAPMRMVRGIHNKILEAMAMGLPVVTTAAAAESLEPELRRHVLPRDHAQGLADAVLSILGDRASARALGQRARESVSTHGRWAERLLPIERRLDALTHV